MVSSVEKAGYRLRVTAIADLTKLRGLCLPSNENNTIGSNSL